MSFRSTEFADDSVRDNQATNGMEVNTHGWAFGQIADMQNWYAQLQTSGKIGTADRFSVTGYSLGGHLAAAFNLLNASQRVATGISKIASTYTFNAAGVNAVCLRRKHAAAKDSKRSIRYKNSSCLRTVYMRCSPKA